MSSDRSYESLLNEIYGNDTSKFNEELHAINDNLEARSINQTSNDMIILMDGLDELGSFVDRMDEVSSPKPPDERNVTINHERSENSNMVEMTDFHYDGNDFSKIEFSMDAKWDDDRNIAMSSSTQKTNQETEEFFLDFYITKVRNELGLPLPAESSIIIAHLDERKDFSSLPDGNWNEENIATSTPKKKQNVFLNPMDTDQFHLEDKLISSEGEFLKHASLEVSKTTKETKIDEPNSAIVQVNDEFWNSRDGNLNGTIPEGASDGKNDSSQSNEIFHGFLTVEIEEQKIRNQQTADSHRPEMVGYDNVMYDPYAPFASNFGDATPKEPKKFVFRPKKKWMEKYNEK